MSSPKRFPSLAAATCGISLLVAGCGVSAQSTPNELDRADVPFRLLEAEPAASPPTGGETSFILYFLDAEGRVAAVTRSGGAGRGPNRSLRQLLAGPTEAEAALGVTTAIPPGTGARATVLSGDLVVIELSGGLVEASGADAGAAIGQLVLTVTEPEGIARVLFRVNGEPVEIPRGDGTLTGGPVGRAEYGPPGASVAQPR